MAGAVPVAPPSTGPTPGQTPVATTSLPAEPEPITIAQGRATPPELPGVQQPNAGSASSIPQASNPGDTALADVIKNLGGKLANGEITPPAAMSTQTQPQAPELPVRTTAASEKFTTYTVASGDSLYKIAKKVYGKGELWKTLADANQDKITPTGNLKVGTTLKVPSIAGAPTLAAAKADAPAAKPEAKVDSSKGKAQPKGKGVTYTIKPGDNLGDIAKRTLGSSKRVGDILAANRGVLDDADSIRAGLVIQIPAK
jgi:nucleoid-associated protein YgaU